MAISHDRLLELLIYEPATGLFRRKIAQGRFDAGSVSGSISAKIGYWEVSVDGQRYYGHRLAWFYMTREWPVATVDHKNLVRSDNKWENLRAASKAQQIMNTPITKRNKSGVKGIFFDQQTQKWGAEIRVNGIRVWLGRFDSLDVAEAIILEKRSELHGQFARYE